MTSIPIEANVRDLDPEAIPEHYARRGLAALSDERLFDLVAAVIAEPKHAPADSFQLHAPLELLARRALLQYADPRRRERARFRLLDLAAAYERAGESLPSGRATEFESVAAAVAALAAALADGDLDATDDAARWLAGRATAPDLAPLADAVVTSLAAAAHAPIYLFALPRVAPRSRAALGLLRPLARELGRQPDWKVAWVDEQPRPRAPNGDLTDAILATPRLGLPGSDFIYPLMHQVEGVAAELLGPVVGADDDPVATSRILLRIAAWSMLQDDPAYAPYGWTHCLTLAQAAAGVAATTAAPVRALAVAATHVVGFRAGISAGPIEPGYDPEPVADASRDALDAPPATAAAAVHHAPAAELEHLATELATRAALHPDAHVAKYTLACLDAAAADPDQPRLYLAAAAYLGAWWGQAATA